MGLFGKKKKTEETAVAPVAKKAVADTGTRIPVHVASMLVKPRITEKAAGLAEKNVYVFEIQKGTTKYDVRDAVKSLYNVTPVKVNIVNKVPRHSMSRARGREVMEHGLRKAYVFLKKGDSINLV